MKNGELGMNVMDEEFAMIGEINNNIFGGLTEGTLRKCKTCGTLLEWNNNQWVCIKCDCKVD